MLQFITPAAPNLLMTSLFGWLVVANALAFLAFFLDHRRALADDGAMPETPLLVLATMGGWLGAQLGRACFRAQTHERGFRVFLNLSVLPVLALAAMMATQDVDWTGLTTKALNMMRPAPPQTAAVATPPVEPEIAPAEDPKPKVRSAGKLAADPEKADKSVTDKADLPKRIGPSSKKEAWQSR